MLLRLLCFLLIYFQLKNLKQKCDFQDEEIQNLRKNAKDNALIAAEQSSTSNVAEEAVRSFIVQVFVQVVKIVCKFIPIQIFILYYICPL